MFDSVFQLFILASAIPALLVALAMWLFYQQNHEDVFIVWALAFLLGAVHYVVEGLVGQGVVGDWLEASLMGAKGGLLLIGCLAMLSGRVHWVSWLLLLAAPVWVLAGIQSAWPDETLRLLPILFAALGYLVLAVSLHHHQREQSGRARHVFALASALAGLLFLSSLWREPAQEPLYSAAIQMLLLIMAVSLLLMLLREQQGLVSVALAGKEGALRHVLRSRRRVMELNDWTDTLLRQVSDGVVICDADDRIVSFNVAAEHMFGYDSAELLGRTYQQLLTPESLQQLMVAGEAEGWRLEGHMDLQGVHRSGMELMLDASFSLLNMGDTTRHMVILRDVTERRKQEARLGFYATHDALTGLCNRHHFETELQKLLEADCKGWLVFLDLDDFKLVNDALGHQAGDAALVAMSKRLLYSLGEHSLVARYSGDEFVFFVPAEDGRTEAQLLEDLNQLLHQPVSTAGMEFMLSGSLGVVRVPEHGETVAVLLRNADLAMYQAKRKGKNNYSLFTHKLLQELGQKADMATRLKSLVPGDELTLFFQPRVALPDRELCGAEALLRWRLPDGSFVSPEAFIPIAEETGQILRIGYWVMEQACRWLSSWTDIHEPFVVSINLSPRQLFDERLVERIEDLRLRYGLAAAQLEFEITESSAMQDPDYAIRVLLRLRALGYGLSLDDFGTGFSSLSQLRRLPVNVLKIDKSFVQNMVENRHDRVMVAAIIELAIHLDISVLAEGVETADQLHLLDALGCNEIQGYLVSEPLPAQRFADEILAHWNQFSRTLPW